MLVTAGDCKSLNWAWWFFVWNGDIKLWSASCIVNMICCLNWGLNSGEADELKKYQKKAQNSNEPGLTRVFRKCFNLSNLNFSNWLWEKLFQHTGDLFRAVPQLHWGKKKRQHIKQTEKFLNQIACLAKLPNRSRGSFVLRTECLLNRGLTLTQSVEQSN